MPKLTLNEKVLLQIGKEKTMGRVVCLAKNAAVELYGIRLDTGSFFPNIMDTQIKEGTPDTKGEGGFYKI